jgi:ferric-dicitrate binding protein FerR (iron transport regulator)
MEYKTHDRIIDYLSNQLNKNERLAFEQWLNKNDSNTQLFNKIALQWHSVEKTTESQLQKAWQNHKALSNQWNHQKTKHLTIYLAVAASLVLMLATGWFVQNTIETTTSLCTNANSFLKDTLDDGSIVYLYPSSNMEIVKETHEIILSGEAFFVIAPQSKDKLTIRMGDALIKVKGTSFRASSLNASGDITVLVESGEIEFWENNARKTPLLVHAGEEAFYSSNKKQLQKSHKSQDIYLIYQPKNIQ